MLDIKNHYIPKGGLLQDDLFRKISSITSNYSDLFIVADFDKTLTTGDSYTIWNMLAKSGIVGENYTNIMHDLFVYYRPFEISNEISFEERSDKMNEWWLKALGLLIEHNINKSKIDGLVIKYINWRNGVKEFLNITKQLNIPIIIVSAGIGNFIEEFFVLHGIDMSNISIESNFLIYNESGIVTGIDKEQMIHTFNKNNHILNDFSRQLVGNRKKTLVLGDSTADIRMIDLFNVEDFLSIGLLTNETTADYFDNSGFDLVNLGEDFGFINKLFLN